MEKCSTLISRPFYSIELSTKESFLGALDNLELASNQSGEARSVPLVILEASDVKGTCAGLENLNSDSKVNGTNKGALQG